MYIQDMLSTCKVVVPRQTNKNQKLVLKENSIKRGRRNVILDKVVDSEAFHIFNRLW
jgi:hypothetical protein